MKLLRLIVLSSLAVAITPVNVHGQQISPVKRELVWSLPGTEIDSLKFSPDGNFIVVVNRAYWPDGHDAEGLPEGVFKDLAERGKKNPRFADPIIKLIDLTGRSVCEAAYGWNPDVSADNTRLVYSRQKKAITGLRVLAETQAGNDIQLFNCGNKQSQTIVGPDTGYLDNPIFFEDGNSIVYTENEGVNGAYAGIVAFSRVELRQNRKSIVLSKKSIPAVPCPSLGESAHDSIICSQATDRTSAYYRLVLQFDSKGEELIALLAMPIPSLPDMWMASHYDIQAVSLVPHMKEFHAFGKQKMGELDKAAIQLISGQKALVFSDYWRVVSLETGEYMADVTHRNTARASIYSPDLKFYLCPEPRDDEPDHYVLYRTLDGKRLMSLPRMVRVNEAAWSRDSKRFAIVGLSSKPRNAAYSEQLTVYSVP